MPGLEPKDYQTAIDIQDACNLSGVVHEFSRMMKKIWEEAQMNSNKGYGTEWVNQHPIAVLFAEKVLHLTTGQTIPGTAINAAWSFCEDHSGKHEEEE